MQMIRVEKSDYHSNLNSFSLYLNGAQREEKKHWCASMSERVNVCAHFATESMYWTKGCARIWFQCLKIYIMFYVIYSNIYKAICSLFLAKKNNSDFVLFISGCRYENYCYQLHVIPLKRFHICFFDNDQYMWAFSPHFHSVYTLYSFTLTQTPNIHTHTRPVERRGKEQQKPSNDRTKNFFYSPYYLPKVSRKSTESIQRRRCFIHFS